MISKNLYSIYKEKHTSKQANSKQSVTAARVFVFFCNLRGDFDMLTHHAFFFALSRNASVAQSSRINFVVTV